MRNLAALTLNYILENYSTKDWLFTDQQTYEYFKQFAINKRGLPPKKVIIAKAPIPPPPKIKVEKPAKEKTEIKQKPKKPIFLSPKPRAKSNESAFNEPRPEGRGVSWKVKQTPPNKSGLKYPALKDGVSSNFDDIRKILRTLYLWPTGLAINALIFPSG